MIEKPTHRLDLYELLAPTEAEKIADEWRQVTTDAQLVLPLIWPEAQRASETDCDA